MKPNLNLNQLSREGKVTATRELPVVREAILQTAAAAGKTESSASTAKHQGTPVTSEFGRIVVVAEPVSAGPADTLVVPIELPDTQMAIFSIKIDNYSVNSWIQIVDSRKLIPPGRTGVVCKGDGTSSPAMKFILPKGLAGLGQQCRIVLYGYPVAETDGESGGSVPVGVISI